MNARKTLSIVGLSTLFALGAPAFAAAGQQQQDVRGSQTELAAGILPDRSEIAANDSALDRNGAEFARALWISWLRYAMTF